MNCLNLPFNVVEQIMLVPVRNRINPVSLSNHERRGSSVHGSTSSTRTELMCFLFGIGIRRLKQIGCWCLLVLLFCHPPIVWAMAGWAEVHSELSYNEYATVHWIHPGDGCDTGNYCFLLERKNNKYDGFHELRASLLKINIPTSENTALVIAQNASDKTWFVYNLQSETYLIKDVAFEEALSAWKKTGLKAPVLSNAEDAAGLNQTWNSRWEEWKSWAFVLLMTLPFISVMALPFCLPAAWRSFKKFKSTANKKDLILSVLFLLPGLVVVFLIANLAIVFLRITHGNS